MQRPEGSGTSFEELAFLLVLWPALLAGLALNRRPAQVPRESETPKRAFTALAGAAEESVLPHLQPEVLMQTSVETLLEFAFLARPHWNAVVLLWQEDTGLRFRHGRAHRRVRRGLRHRGRRGAAGMDPARREDPGRGQSVGQRRPGPAVLPPSGQREVVHRRAFFNEGRLQGCLVDEQLEEGDFSETETRSLEALGKHLVFLSQQARLSTALEDQGRRFSRLHVASRNWPKTSTARPCCGVLPDLFQALVPYDSCYLALNDETDAPLRIVFQRGYDQDFVEHFQMDVHSELGGWVLTEGEPLRFEHRPLRRADPGLPEERPARTRALVFAHPSGA